MINRRLLLATITQVVFVTLLAVSVAWCVDKPTPVVTVRYAHNFPDTKWSQGYVHRMCAELMEQKSNGQIKVNLHPLGELFRDTEMPEAVMTGAVDIGCLQPDILAGTIPLVQALTIPFAVPTFEKLHKVVDSQAGEILKREMEKVGIKLLFWSSGQEIDYIGNKPARKPEDITGLRVRSYGRAATETLKGWGAVPIVMSSLDLYSALQKKTVDGALSAPVSMIKRKLHEVSKYQTALNMSAFVHLVTANLNWWNKLSSQHQQIILQAAKEAQSWVRVTAPKEGQEAREISKKLGVEVFYVPVSDYHRWAKAAQKVRQDYVNKTGAAGEELLRIIDAIN